LTSELQREWLTQLRTENVFFSEPLDLDWALLRAFRSAYTKLDDGQRGPGNGDASDAVLGKSGIRTEYQTAEEHNDMRWYRYLFLGRSKPSTHLRTLTSLSESDLRESTPDEIEALLEIVKESLVDERS
jgi:hypothetical protein